MENGLKEEILSDIEVIGKDEKLLAEKNFISRTEAIDDIEFHITDRLQTLKTGSDLSEPINELILCAEKVKHRLEEVNTKMFEKLRTKISLGKYRGELLIQLVDEYLDHYLNDFPEHAITGYDHLDLFLNGLLTYREPPDEVKEREPGMIYYQKTPARIVFELIKKAAFQPGDVFYDLGSGLGQVSILVNLLTCVVSKGVEFEPAYYNYAKTCASELNLNDVEFINADARYADCSAGTVFFMYTPFEGQMLRDVLWNLHTEAKKRRIRIFTYGTCTPALEREHWLMQTGETKNYDAEPSEFVSVC